MGLLALAAGFALFFILLLVLERDRQARRFWLGRVAVAAVVGVVLAKLAPLWTKFDAVLSNPMLLVTDGVGTAGLFGGAFAFAGVALVSLAELRRARIPGRPLRLLLSAAAGLLLTLGLVVLLPKITGGPAELHVAVPDLEGHPHTLAEWKGKVVLLNFWATWCPPCVAELPDLKNFAATSKTVTVIGVDALATEQGGVPAVLRFAADNKISWAQLADPEGLLQRAYRVGALPTTVILADGKVLARHEGAIDRAWLDALGALAVQ